MDRQDRSIVPLLKLPFQMVFFVTITLIFAIGCLVTGIFSKHLSQVICHAWTRIVIRFLGIRLQVSGREKLTLGRRYVFFSNHQSALDIPVLFAGLGFPICFISKKELFLIPIFGWGMAAMGHVGIDRANARKARESLTRGVRLLKRHRLSLVLFPEGTRSADGALGEFRQGSFSLALEADVAAVPVVIRKANERLPKKSLLVNPGVLLLDICDPVDIAGMEKNQLSATVRCAIEAVLQSA